MKRVDGIVGNIHTDPELAADIAAREEAGTLERVVLETSDRRKSRLRVETDAGTDLGILVDQPELSAGDVLFVDDDHAALIEFEEIEAFVIELPEATESTLLATAELGHRIGNQHWDLAVEAGTLYVPVEADRSIIETVLGEYLPAGAETRYETVAAEQFVDGEMMDHGHADHDHSHGDDDGHSHDHGDHDHSHGDGDHTDHDGGHSHD